MPYLIRIQSDNVSYTMKVTAGLAESNGSLPPALWRHLRADCLETRISRCEHYDHNRASKQVQRELVLRCRH